MTQFIFIVLILATCIYAQSEQDVISALKQAKINIAERAKNEKDDTSNLQSQIANAESQAKQRKGDILLETTKILVDKFGSDAIDKLSKFNVDALFVVANITFPKKP